MYILTTEASFDAAHFLSNYSGKCANIHGHRWRVVVSIKGTIINGMIVDFKDFKDKLSEVCDYFDHSFIVEDNSIEEPLLSLLKEKFLIREVSFRTTAENFSKYFYDKLKDIYDVKEVHVYETPNNKASYICE